MKPAGCPFHEKDIPQVLEIEKIAIILGFSNAMWVLF
jgi:hypothetical protein